MDLRKLPIIMFLFVGVCHASTLFNDVYRNVNSSDPRVAATSFVILSNVSWSMLDIETIESDYLQETDAKKKYYYEFLLSKITQEKKYTDSFIDHSKYYLSDLSSNNTDWISIASPFYEHLALYSHTDDRALDSLMKLVASADGANLSIIVEKLNDISKLDPERFLKQAKKNGLDVKEFLLLIEE